MHVFICTLLLLLQLDSQDHFLMSALFLFFFSLLISVTQNVTLPLFPLCLIEYLSLSLSPSLCVYAHPPSIPMRECICVMVTMPTLHLLESLCLSLSVNKCVYPPPCVCVCTVQPPSSPLCGCTCALVTIQLEADCLFPLQNILFIYTAWVQSLLNQPRTQCSGGIHIWQNSTNQRFHSCRDLVYDYFMSSVNKWNTALGRGAGAENVKGKG